MGIFTKIDAFPIVHILHLYLFQGQGTSIQNFTKIDACPAILASHNILDCPVFTLHLLTAHNVHKYFKQ